MTVNELIAALQKHPGGAPVRVEYHVRDYVQTIELHDTRELTTVKAERRDSGLRLKESERCDDYNHKLDVDYGYPVETVLVLR